MQVSVHGVAACPHSRHSHMATWHICQVWKTQQNCCHPHCHSHHLGYFVLPAHHCTFGPRGPGLSNQTFFLGPALLMAPTTDDNIRWCLTEARFTEACLSYGVPSFERSCTQNVSKTHWSMSACAIASLRHEHRYVLANGQYNLLKMTLSLKI